MRIVAAIVCLLVMLPCAMAEDVTCWGYLNSRNTVEWVERGEQHGVRLVARDARWRLHGLGLEGTRGAVCETCSSGQVTGAAIWLGARDFAPGTAQDLERALSLDAVAQRMAVAPMVMRGVFQAKGDVVPASLGELTGRARRISIDLHAGKRVEVIALNVVRGCVSMFAILNARAGAEIAADGLEVFAQGIDVEWYTPVPDPLILRTKPPKWPWPRHPGLGNDFRPQDWGLQ